jgi:hypothetical protein
VVARLASANANVEQRTRRPHEAEAAAEIAFVNQACRLESPVINQR